LKLKTVKKAISSRSFLKSNGVTNMDHDSFFRNKIESMLITASWVEPVQKMLGITGVSQVWDDAPEWYIWIAGAPGVYALVFDHGRSFDALDQTLHQGRFAVKCYPYASAGVFDTYSAKECDMVSSDLFDHTHTPRMEARPEIPEAFFTIGSISLTLDAAQTVALFTFDSLDFLRWSTLTAKPGPGNRPGGKCLIRNIPAWQIGYPLFDRMAGLYAFYSKRQPAFIGTTRSPGFECIIDPPHSTPESQSCDSIQQGSASVMFAETTNTERLKDAIWHEQLDAEEHIVFVSRCRHSDCSASASDNFPPVEMNRLWWELAQSEIKSELATTCGCCDHGHQPDDVRCH
jgi:hypothetical protein